MLNRNIEKFMELLKTKLLSARLKARAVVRYIKPRWRYMSTNKLFYLIYIFIAVVVVQSS